MPVRTATAQDAPVIIDLLRLMHAEIGQFRLSEERMVETYRSVEEKGQILVLTAPEGFTIGSCGLHGYSPWYSEEVVIQDHWFYIHEKHRSQAAFSELLAAVHGFAAAARLPLILGVWSYKSPKAKQRLFGAYMHQICEAFQFVPVGGQFRSGKGE